MASAEFCQAEVSRLADEQAALRRVATLVAQGASPPQVFSAVASEIGRLLNTYYITINRFEPDHTITVVGHWSHPDRPEVLPPLSGHYPIDDDPVAATVARTGQPTRIIDDAHADTRIGEWARESGITSVVACPVMVKRRVWGMVASLSPGLQPADTEARMLQFVVLVSAAIASAETGAELRASRGRLVAAADATRRRVERELHDAVQQRLISLGLQLREAEACLAPGHDVLKGQLARTAQGLTDALEDLRDISRGLHPAILSEGGLAPALESLVRRFALPVELNVDLDERLAEPVEVAVYYSISEALTNALEHARATHVRVDVLLDNDTVRISVHDDGIGGADPGRGSGLIGLKDRTEALGGKFQLVSPAGKGTSLLIKIPIHGR